MTRLPWTRAMVIAAIAVLATPVRASSGDPLEELARATQALAAALKRRAPDWSPEAEAANARVGRVLAGILDHAELARRALGPDWARLTDEQRREFLATFTALTDRTFATRMTR